MSSPYAEQMLVLAAIVMKFGEVNRATQHPDGRPESDTTHTVMLGLVCEELVPLVSADLGVELDAGLVARFALVHDLPEVFAGDTNTARRPTKAQRLAKQAREAEAIVELSCELGRGSGVMDLLSRYERQEELEARVVRLIDKMMPKLTHMLNNGSALRSMGMKYSDVLDSHQRQGQSLREQYPEQTFLHQLFAEICDLSEKHLIHQL